MQHSAAIAELKTFLANPTAYADGVALYMRFGPYESWKDIFQRQPGSKEQLKELCDHLRRAMKNMEADNVPPSPVIVTVTPPIVPDKPASVTEPVTAVTVASDHFLKEKEDEWKNLYREAARLHGTFLTIEELGGDKAAVVMKGNALRIAAIAKEIAAIKADMEYYQINGRPPQTDVTKSDAVTLVDVNDKLMVNKRILTLRTYVTRENNNMKTAQQLEQNAITIMDEQKRIAQAEKAKQKYAAASGRYDAVMKELTYLQSLQ